MSAASLGTIRLAERLIRSLPVNRWYDDRSRPRIAARFFGPGSKPIKSSSSSMSWFRAKRISRRGLRRAADAFDVSSAPIGGVGVVSLVAVVSAPGTTPILSSLSTMANGADVEPMSATRPEWLTPTIGDVETFEKRTPTAGMPFMDGLNDCLIVPAT